MGTANFTSVEDYLAAQDATKAATLKAVIAFILEAFPELALKMAWNVPQIHRGGDYVMGLAAYKKHLTLAPWSVFVMESFKDRLQSYVVFKNCFQIPVDWEIDRNLLTDLVRARLAELG